jgi:DNA-binding GntR family transcriptional regulator
LSSVTPVASSVVDPNIVSQAFDFHVAIAEASGSAELQDILRNLRNQITLVMSAGLVSLPGDRAKEIHAEHLSIISAIEDHEGDRAERLATAHVLGGRDRMVHLDDD